jgi:hypothetical protein
MDNDLYISQGVTVATFYGTADAWRRFADRMRGDGHRRIAEAIDSGVSAQCARHSYYADGCAIPLRFRDGSIATINAYLDDEPETPEGEANG